MTFEPTAIPGVFVVHPERFEDERGYFARTWAGDELAARGLTPGVAQCSTSFNTSAGTLRGLHYQASPHAEAKLVRCTRGRIFDVAVDLRPGSPTFRQWTARELDSESGVALYIPEGCAHGFLTLEDACDVFYMVSAPYVPAAGRGVRWDDPAFGIEWPADVRVINERDASYPDFEG